MEAQRRQSEIKRFSTWRFVGRIAATVQPPNFAELEQAGESCGYDPYNRPAQCASRTTPVESF